MYRSPGNCNDLNLKTPAPSLKQGKDDSDLSQHQNQQMSSSLSRFRSAPSSLFGEMSEDAETMYARYIAPDLRDQIGEKSSLRSLRFLPEMEREVGEASSAVVVDDSFRLEEEREKSVRRSAPIRQSSSPAGLFSLLSAETDFSLLSGRDFGEFRHGNSSNGEVTNPSNSRMKCQISFSRQSSASSLMSQIPDIAGESMAGSSPEDASRCFIPGLPVSSWDDPENDFSIGIKRNRDESQIADHIQTLTHHFSLPKTSSEMAAVLQFQDAVPCKIRAKRGCATHPRSIAERIRRTRISERIRRLQELVPNMDKQTNTADMLDFAVDYIKELEEKIKLLSESKTNCSCSVIEKP